MFNTTLPGDGTRTPGSLSFIDGDTLVAALPPVVDFHRVKQLQYDINCSTDRRPAKILLDFTPVEKLTATGISAIIALGLFSLEQGIELLFLESSPGIRRQLEPLLPAVFWINQQSPGGGDLNLQYRSVAGGKTAIQA